MKKVFDIEINRFLNLNDKRQTVETTLLTYVIKNKIIKDVLKQKEKHQKKEKKKQEKVRVSYLS